MSLSCEIYVVPTHILFRCHKNSDGGGGEQQHHAFI